MLIDLFETLEKPMVGLVHRITSPKGIRVPDKNGRYDYRLHNELVDLYDNKPVELKDGLYWVTDVFKIERLQWNQYLCRVHKGKVTFIAEYIDVHNSEWIKEALPIIKGYKSAPEITLTKFKHPTENNRWGRVRK